MYVWVSMRFVYCLELLNSMPALSKQSEGVYLHNIPKKGSEKPFLLNIY